LLLFNLRNLFIVKPEVVSAPEINKVSSDNHSRLTLLLLPRIVLSRIQISVVSVLSIIRTPYEVEVVAPQSVINITACNVLPGLKILLEISVSHSPAILRQLD
jgi:hypothetical protein